MSHPFNAVESFQARLVAAQSLREAVRSTGQRLTVNSSGLITLFHSTSIENAQSIRKSGELLGNVWLAASKGVSLLHAKKHGRNATTLEVTIDARHIEFSTGTGEFYAPEGLVKQDTGEWRPPTRSTP